MRPRAWERDKAFMDVAAVAWPEDFETSQNGQPAWQAPKQAARGRLARRYEGCAHSEILAGKVEDMEKAIAAMKSKVVAVRGAT